MTIGSEYRHQTITATFLADPRRGPRHGRQGRLAARHRRLLRPALASPGAVGAGTLVLTAKGTPRSPTASIWRTLALSLLVLGLWALIGLGVGILIPNQVAALLISVARRVDRRAGARPRARPDRLGQSISPYLPSRATAPMLETSSGGFDGQPVDQLAWWAGALVLVAYAAVMAGLGTWRTMRADISLTAVRRAAATSTNAAPGPPAAAGHDASRDSPSSASGIATQRG